MKPMPSVALATWMLEHVTFGSPNESLSGDLLEELRSGRSAGWYWRQALSAIAVTLSFKSRAYVLPLAFSRWLEHLVSGIVAFVIAGIRLTQAHIGTDGGARLAILDRAVLFVSATIPAAMFVSIGFFVYLTSSNQVARQPSTLRILRKACRSASTCFS